MTDTISQSTRPGSIIAPNRGIASEAPIDRIGRALDGLDGIASTIRGWAYVEMKEGGDEHGFLCELSKLISEHGQDIRAHALKLLEASNRSGT